MKNLKVLYVEDDPDVAKAMMLIFEPFFQKVDHGINGKEGYELFTKNSYDLIITDINMPKLNGLDMIEKIRAVDQNIAVIITSAYNSPDYFTRSIELGVDGYSLKPIIAKQLFNVIQKISKSIDEKRLNLKNQKLLEEYKSALDDSTIVSKTDKDGIITYVNDSFIKLSGYSREELIGSNHNIIRHPDTKKGIFADMWDTILQKYVWKGRVKNRKKNGDHYWVDVTISPILDENNEIIEFIAVRKEITLEIEYQKNLEQKVKEKIDQLRQKDKILHQQSKQAAMGEMIDAIAHQWKQPINIIKMKTEMMGYDYEDGELNSETIKAFQNDIFSQIEHTLHTLEEFRNFLRPNKTTNEFSVSETINSVLVLVKDEFMRNLITTNIDIKEDIKVNGIENEFKHVILNIINNAKDAFIQNNIENRNILITLENNIIKIEDNAGGIPSGVIDHIFEANVTTKEDIAGTGIGLYMTKQIVEKVNGTIEVANIDNGACFTISL